MAIVVEHYSPFTVCPRGTCGSRSRKKSGFSFRGIFFTRPEKVSPQASAATGVKDI